MTKQESQIQVSTVEAGTVTARSDFSKPPLPKALSHLCSMGRGLSSPSHAASNFRCLAQAKVRTPLPYSLHLPAPPASI